MGKTTVILFLLNLLSFSIKSQNLNICSGDSVKIILNNYISGSSIQWQNSPNLTAWNNITGATSATLNILPINNVHYRAAISQGTNCPTYYSDTTNVTIHNWSAGLTLNQIELQTIGSNTFTSSSKLKANWIAPSAYSVDHYLLTATESIKNTTIELSVPFSQLTDTIEGLKSGTLYRVKVKACGNTTCSNYLDCSNTFSITTSEEYWQLQGSGNSLTTLTKIVSDGNTLNYAFVYGNWAPTGLNGYTRYYYNPSAGTEKGTKPAISNSVAITNVNSTAISFTGLTGYGLRHTGWVTGNNTPKFIGQAQAIPHNGSIDLFFEAQTDDLKTRIFKIDSKDGYYGIDFNSDASTLCTNPSDFTTSGGCAYQLILGVETDPVPFNNPSVTDIRQFKIGYKTMNSWLWEGNDSTFMTPTFDLNSSINCGNTYKFTTGYAIFDSINNKWKLEYNSSTCPKFFDGMQAPSIVHLGNNKYKLYFNNNQTLKGMPHNPLTDTKPMKVMYAENKNGKIKFDDWEGVVNSRNLNYLWPDGTLLTVSEESKLDDYHFFAPTNNLKFQVQYTNISSSTSIPFVAAAILLNP